jgi:hypothetical protein
MKRFLLLIFLIIGATQFSFSQYYTQQITNVKTQANKMGEALIKKDYNYLMKCINPDGIPKPKFNAITPKKMLATLMLIDSQMVKQGIVIQSIKVGDVLSILKENGVMQCTLPQTTEMKMQFGKIINTSTLVAISNDNGITWKFTDAIGRDKIEMKKLMPLLSDKLIFAKKAPPTFIKQDEKSLKK